MFHGSFGSIEAGYCRMAASPVVLCGEAGINLGRARGTSYAFTTSAQNTYIRTTQTIDWLVTAGPKLGLAIDANQLFIYASGGAALAQLGADATSTIVGAIGSGSVSGPGLAGSWAPAWSGCSPPVSASSSITSASISKGSTTRLLAGPRSSTSRVVDNVFSAGFNFHFNSGLVYAQY